MGSLKLTTFNISVHSNTDQGSVTWFRGFDFNHVNLYFSGLTLVISQEIIPGTFK